MPVEETIINEVETPPVTVTTSEFDGLTKSARRRLKKKLVSQSTLNTANSPDTDDNEIIDELSSVEATTNTKTESENSNPVQQNVTVGIDVPPNDLQIIIDKMASYVTKNGKQFEETARKRQDPRLKFLEPDDCFNAYYTQKLKLYATIKRLEQTAPLKLNVDSKTNSKLPVCFSLKKQKESEAVEIKKSALEDSANETSDDEHKKDRSDKTEFHHIKLIKSSTSVKKNPLQNTAKLAEERLKDKLAMAAKEKLSMLERERTKKEKEKIQAERKRKAAQFLASMKIISSSSKNSNIIKSSEKPDIQDSPVHTSVVNSVDQKTSIDENNGLPDDDVKDLNIQPLPSKVQDVISIGSSDEDISNDGNLNKNMNGNKSSKLSLQSRLQETLSRDNKRKKNERCDKERDNYKRIKHYDESKDKTPDHRYSSRDRDRSSRRSKKSHSSHHSSSKDHKRERGSRRSKHKHKSKKSKKHTRNHNSDSSDNSSNTNNSRFS